MNEEEQRRQKKIQGIGRIFKPRWTRKLADGRTTAQESPFWWIAYYHRGKEYRESSGSANETAALKLLRQRVKDLGRGRIGPVEEKVTFDMMSEDLLNDYRVNAKRSLRSANLSVGHLKKFFGFDRAIDITTDRVRAYISHRQQEIAEQRQRQSTRMTSKVRQLKETANGLHGSEKDKLLAEAGWLEARAKKLERISNASINRELAALKRMFSLAVQAGKLSSKPYIPTLEENNARQGFLDHGTFLLLRENLPDYLKDPVTFLYFSGWRVSEMKSLEWRDVDLTGKVVRLRPEISKNKDGRLLPLKGELLQLIEKAKDGRRPDCPYVFHLNGQPVGDFRKAWKKACQATGLNGIIIHDLRRTAVRNMVRAGIPELVAMRLSGHKTRSIFDRYNIVSEADLARASEQLQSHLENQSKGPVIVPLVVVPKVTVI